METAEAGKVPNAVKDAMKRDDFPPGFDKTIFVRRFLRDRALAGKCGRLARGQVD